MLTPGRAPQISAVLPHRLRRLLLASPLFGHWRKWAGKTGSAALEELFPGEGKEETLLKSYLAGLRASWVDWALYPA